MNEPATPSTSSSKPAAPITLTEEQIDGFQQTGFVLLRSVFTAEELILARPHVDASDKEALAADPDLKSRVCFGNPTSGEDPTKISKLEMLRGVPRFAPLFGLCTDPRITSTADQLLGDGAQLMKDKYIFKTAGQGQGFTPHQDMQYVFHRFAHDSVSFYIAFDDADSENGGLEVAPLPLDKLRGRLLAPVSERPLPEMAVADLDWQCPTLRTGDVLAFSAWTVHRSQPNVSDRDRSVYYPTYSTGHSDDGDQAMYDEYYEFYWEWIKARLAGDDPSIDTLLPGKPRPSLHPVRGHTL